MATCEMCGESGDLTRAQVEGATLKLCENCQDVGNPVDTEAVSAPSSSSSRPRPRQEESEEVVEDYADQVNQAREDSGLSVADLADELKEKESVVRRVETGKLVPNRKLARKLERALDIGLYEELREGRHQQQESSGEDDATIGDVAQVRKKDE